MRKIKADGRLRHCFFGTYSAVLILVFNDKESAADALVTMGEPWKTHPKEPKALTCTVTSEQLEKVTAQLVSFGAEEKKIASLAKSVDFGEPFTVEVPITPAEQKEMFS